MKKIWISGTILLTSFWYQVGWASLQDTVNVTNESNHRAVPRNPFSGDQSTIDLSHSDVSEVYDVKLHLVEEKLLSQQLTDWAYQNGYKLLWNSSKDFMIYHSIYLQAKTKEGILVELGKIFTSENYGLVIKNYQNNNVLIIDEQ